ncbi:hypothetical protein ACUW9V_001130 [Staphylococcus epidermidis]|nr:hypothetical protein SAMN04487862_1103 [Staphylococcus epidermidis]
MYLDYLVRSGIDEFERCRKEAKRIGKARIIKTSYAIRNRKYGRASQI